LHVNDAQLQAATSATLQEKKRIGMPTMATWAHYTPMDPTSVALADFVDLVAASYTPRELKKKQTEKPNEDKLAPPPIPAHSFLLVRGPLDLFWPCFLFSHEMSANDDACPTLFPRN